MGTEDPAAPAPGTSEVREVGCQVAGCTNPLPQDKKYHHRYKICEYHVRLDQIELDGILKRFCQQCGRYHELEQFDGSKRSCRNRLERHNERRREGKGTKRSTQSPSDDERTNVQIINAATSDLEPSASAKRRWRSSEFEGASSDQETGRSSQNEARSWQNATRSLNASPVRDACASPRSGGYVGARDTPSPTSSPSGNCSPRVGYLRTSFETVDAAKRVLEDGGLVSFDPTWRQHTQQVQDGQLTADTCKVAHTLPDGTLTFVTFSHVNPMAGVKLTGSAQQPQFIPYQQPSPVAPPGCVVLRRAVSDQDGLPAVHLSPASYGSAPTTGISSGQEWAAMGHSLSQPTRAPSNSEIPFNTPVLVVDRYPLLGAGSGSHAGLQQQNYHPAVPNAAQEIACFRTQTTSPTVSSGNNVAYQNGGVASNMQLSQLANAHSAERGQCDPANLHGMAGTAASNSGPNSQAGQQQSVYHLCPAPLDGSVIENTQRRLERIAVADGASDWTAGGLQAGASSEQTVRRQMLNQPAGQAAPQMHATVTSGSTVPRPLTILLVARPGASPQAEPTAAHHVQGPAAPHHNSQAVPNHQQQLASLMVQGPAALPASHHFAMEQKVQQLEQYSNFTQAEPHLRNDYQTGSQQATDPMPQSHNNVPAPLAAPALTVQDRGPPTQFSQLISLLRSQTIEIPGLDSERLSVQLENACSQGVHSLEELVAMLERQPDIQGFEVLKCLVPSPPPQQPPSQLQRQQPQPQPTTHAQSQSPDLPVTSHSFGPSSSSEPPAEAGGSSSLAQTEQEILSSWAEAAAYASADPATSGLFADLNEMPINISLTMRDSSMMSLGGDSLIPPARPLTLPELDTSLVLGVAPGSDVLPSIPSDFIAMWASQDGNVFPGAGMSLKQRTGHAMDLDVLHQRNSGALEMLQRSGSGELVINLSQILGSEQLRGSGMYGLPCVNLPSFSSLNTSLGNSLGPQIDMLHASSNAAVPNLNVRGALMAHFTSSQGSIQPNRF